MGFLSGLKNVAKAAIKWTGDKLKKAAEVTLDVCHVVAEATAEVCHWVAGKCSEWATKIKGKPKDPVAPSAKKADTPLVTNAVNTIKSNFPQGIKETVKNLNEEEKVRKLETLVHDASAALGIENVPELKLFIPESLDQINSQCGAYNPNENTLNLNFAMIVSEEPELYQEQVNTVFHELIHARQCAAINDWKNGKPIDKYGYSEDYIIEMAVNRLNYIRPEENYEAYTKQPIEAEAFWFEQQIKSGFQN